MEKSLAEIPLPDLLQTMTEELARLTGKLRKSVDEEVVHQVRVSIKKWKMTGRLLQKLYKIPWKRDFKSTAILFRVCGEQRNLEQGIQICKKKDLVTPGITSYFRRELIRAKQQTRMAIRQYDISDVFKYLDRVNTHFTGSLPQTKNLQNEEDRLIEKAAKLFHQKPRPLHTIRKRLKDLLFLREFTRQAQGKQRKLNRILDLLGKIQDFLVLDELVEQGHSKGVISDKEGRKLKEKTKPIRKQLVKHSVGQLRAFLFPNK